MLSQNVPNELVVPGTYMPPRVKSAYVKLVGNTNNNNLYSSKRMDLNRFLDDSSELFGQDYSMRSNSPEPKTKDYIPSARELVTARNNAERITELERTNLNLKRMLEFVVNDPSRNPMGYQLSPGGVTPRLLAQRNKANNSLLGPPQLRSGRIGSSWRHIKQTNNYTNSNLLFIDGTVRINDSSRFPPQVYGYPPRVVNHSEDLIGLTTQSLSNLDLPLESKVRNRPANLKPYDNQFSDRAKKGFEYWSRDKRIPENNKPKAETIAIGHPYFKPGF